MIVGVLALQGAFREHQEMLAACGVKSIQVRKPEELEKIDALIIPGGESTTIGKLMKERGLLGPITVLSKQGMPVFGTCAGLILLAKEIEESNQERIGLMNIKVRRNAFGRQVESFEEDLEIAALGKDPFRAVFIRAPYITETAPSVAVLAVYRERPVCVQEGAFLAAAFHPELTGDRRLHEYFLEMVKKNIAQKRNL
jgi:5'-phosphate synthase pdxT subunit